MRLVVPVYDVGPANWLMEMEVVPMVIVPSVVTHQAVSACVVPCSTNHREFGLMPSEVRVLNALRTYYDEHRIMPSYGELARLAGFKARSYMLAVVRRLRDRSIVDVTPKGWLKPGAAWNTHTPESGKP